MMRKLLAVGIALAILIGAGQAVAQRDMVTVLTWTFIGERNSELADDITSAAFAMDYSHRIEVETVTRRMISPPDQFQIDLTIRCICTKPVEELRCDLLAMASLGEPNLWSATYLSMCVRGE